VALSEAERAGVLVIRVWIEPGAGDGLRARITRTVDISERDEIVTVASTPDEITETVADWLAAYVAANGE
jgi:hypothetical protein